MGDEPQTTPDTVPEAPAAPAPVPAPPPAAPAADLTGLPDWAQSEIKNLRKESASYRTKAKSLEDESKSELQRALDALEASKTELSTTRTELTRSKVMTEFGIDPELSDFLNGDEAAMRAAAEKLSRLATDQRAASLRSAPVAALQSGGTAPAAEADWDPAEIARQVRDASLY
ncbi:hypothetical protein [Glycomyces buryatensis]|uniref:DUF4355 domain-containing protein n=1 Tax=Glycomyces buryatensis TaxID=2570927 RepID=A0A4S8Q8B3_9ACTN|nr:hypothetical protein [Glycomyces buryatensis]THV39621.1 hypothetical protein FAB82_17270 [Glycomyces buryatensis]